MFTYSITLPKVKLDIMVIGWINHFVRNSLYYFGVKAKLMIKDVLFLKSYSVFFSLKWGKNLQLNYKEGCLVDGSFQVTAKISKM